MGQMRAIGESVLKFVEKISNRSQSGSKPARYFEPECETCGDLGWVGGRRCVCHVRKRIAARLEKLNRRYTKFASFNLMSLSADESRHPKQAELIPMIQTDPEMSLLMFG